MHLKLASAPQNMEFQSSYRQHFTFAPSYNIVNSRKKQITIVLQILLKQIAQELGTSIGRDRSLMCSGGCQNISACKISGRFFHKFSTKCPEAHYVGCSLGQWPVVRTDGWTDGWPQVNMLPTPQGGGMLKIEKCNLSNLIMSFYHSRTTKSVFG